MLILGELEKKRIKQLNNIKKKKSFFRKSFIIIRGLYYSLIHKSRKRKRVIKISI